jgi:hypothetical protein
MTGKHFIIDMYGVYVNSMININKDDIEIEKWNNNLKIQFSNANVNC